MGVSLGSIKFQGTAVSSQEEASVYSANRFGAGGLEQGLTALGARNTLSGFKVKICNASSQT